MKYASIVFAILLISSCSNKNIDAVKSNGNDKIVQDEDEVNKTNFNKFLTSTLHFKKTKDSITYVLISDDACEACINATVSRLASKPNFLFILSNNNFENHLKKLKLPAQRVIIDKSLQVNRLVYTNRNVGVVQSSGDDIYNVVYIKTHNLYGALTALAK